MKRFGTWELLLFGLLLFHLVSNSLWILINNAPFPWDQAAHASLALQAATHIKSFQLFSLVQISNYYPILIHTIAGIFLFLFGPSLKLTQVISTLFFTGTLVIIYLYFKELSKSHKIAFLTTCLFSFFPMVFHYSKWLMLDIPSVGSIFLTLYFWEKSDMLINRKYTILTFISLGIVMMIKWTGILFLIIPLFLTIRNFVKSPQKKKKLISIIYGIVLFFIIVLPWYITNLQQFIFLSKINIVGEQGVDANILSIANFTRYIDEFINLQTTPYFTITFVVCSAILLFKKWPRKYYVFSMIALAYLIFTFISNKDGRYTMPILPFAAFVVVYGLERLNKTYKFAGNVLISLLFGILFAYYLLLTIRPPAIEGTFVSFNMRLIRFDFINFNDWLVTKYDRSNWELPTMLNDLEKASQNKPVSVVVSLEDPHLNTETMQTYLAVQQYQKQLTNISFTTPDITYLITKYHANSFPSNNEIDRYLAKNDYVLLSPSYIGPNYIRNYDALSQVRNYTVDNATNFCSNYIQTVAAKNTTCYVNKNEILITQSDISIDGKTIRHGMKTINGYAKVYCPYGCSFQRISKSLTSDYLNITLVSSYSLPDKTIVRLYKLH